MELASFLLIAIWSITYVTFLAIIYVWEILTVVK